MRTSWLLILFALPGLIGSVLLMRLASAEHSMQIQQMVLALISILFVLWMAKVRLNQGAKNGSSMPRQIRNSVLLLVSTLLGLTACFAFSEAENPSRWLKLGGIRLYFSVL